MSTGTAEHKKIFDSIGNGSTRDVQQVRQQFEQKTPAERASIGTQLWQGPILDYLASGETMPENERELCEVVLGKVFEDVSAAQSVPSGRSS